MEDNKRKVTSNPSRKQCVSMIQRILMTEVLEKGRNQQFKKSTDFMTFFESLYPASPSLTKQVQRALHSMNLPKDENGYFIINKTDDQIQEDKEISNLLTYSKSEPFPLEQIALLFLPIEEPERSYLISLIQKSKTFQGKFTTMFSSSNGILFLTEQPAQLKTLIQSII